MGRCDGLRPQLPDVPNLFRNRHVDAAAVLVDLRVVERVVDVREEGRRRPFTRWRSRGSSCHGVSKQDNS